MLVLIVLLSVGLPARGFRESLIRANLSLCFDTDWIGRHCAYECVARLALVGGAPRPLSVRESSGMLLICLSCASYCNIDRGSDVNLVYTVIDVVISHLLGLIAL